MRTKIIITGQPSGNAKLVNSISDKEIEAKQIPNGWVLVYRTKKEAYDSLREGYEFMKANGEQPLKYGKNILRYDASVATIVNFI